MKSQRLRLRAATRSITASLTDDIRGPEPAGQGNAVGVPTEHDDLLRTEPASGDDTARPIHYNGDLKINNCLLSLVLRE